MTNRKSHTPFRLVPKSTILDDLERPICICFRKDASFGTHHKKLNEDRPVLSAAKVQAIDSSFGDIRFMRIFAGVLRRGASNDSGVIENVDFQGFWTLRLRHLRKWGQHYYVVLFSPLLPFQWPQNIWPWMTLTGYLALNSVFAPVWLDFGK